MAGINSYRNSLANQSDCHELILMWGQSNCSGPGIGADYSSNLRSAIPNSYIWFNGGLQQLQLGVNNKNNPNGNGGYELPVSYALQNGTGRRVYIAKRDQGGTQIYKEADGASTTQLTISNGGKTFFTNTGKSWGTTRLRLANSATNYMDGGTSTYNSGTGETQIAIDSTSGSGQFSNWTVSVVNWNVQSVNMLRDQWMNNYVYPMLNYLLSNNIKFRITVLQVHGEEDGLDTTKANAYSANLDAFYLKTLSDIPEYINTNFAGKVIPQIKWICSKPVSPSTGNGNTIRAAIDTLVAKYTGVYSINTVGAATYEGIHLTSASFELYGANGNGSITPIKTIIQNAWAA